MFHARPASRGGAAARGAPAARGAAARVSDPTAVELGKHILL